MDELVLGYWILYGCRLYGSHIAVNIHLQIVGQLTSRLLYYYYYAVELTVCVRRRFPEQFRAFVESGDDNDGKKATGEDNAYANDPLH